MYITDYKWLLCFDFWVFLLNPPKKTSHDCLTVRVAQITRYGHIHFQATRFEQLFFSNVTILGGLGKKTNFYPSRYEF